MIKLTDITTGEKAGRGYYDELMRTTADQLAAEYDAGRITGADYAHAYIAMLQTVLPVATQTVLQYHLNNKQLEIMDEQLEQAKQNTDLIKAQIKMLEEQILASTYNRTELMPLQKEMLTEQIDLLQSQDLGQLAQNQLLTTQNAGQLINNDNMTKQGQLIDEQIKTATAQTTTPVAGLTKATYDKAIAETSVINQKLITERAQTEGTYLTQNGLIGSEMNLKHVQSESFLRDAEQKAAKLYGDTLGIVFSSDPAGQYSDPDRWGYGPTDAAKVTDQLLRGIGVAP